ncbi:lymphocyte specific protein 1 b isoform X2 [Conger conger]|uniref:lymphocyte specific protein 1 b isoform X2 n=1 Tax=Conger conger TaxID=82655 RepID=UPI002A5998DF|nr:lymphocyte specific protein 1 b isoform X2 [Conger conger]
MSGTALRRSTNKQGLHNLLRLTAQRSVEDAEETQREQRRRAREAARAHAGGTGSWGAPRDSVPQTQDNSSPSDSTVPQSGPQCENSVPQSVPQCENSVPQSLPQWENSVPQSVPQCENSVPQSVPQCENSVPQSVPQCENSVPQSVPKCENSVPQSVPQCENSVPQSVPKCENSVPASKDSTPQSEDQAPPSKDRALDASLKPGHQATLEEDEGFSDWTLKFGGTRQHRPEEQSPERASSVDGSLLFPTHPTSRRHEEEQENRGGCETKDSERSGEPQRSIREEVGEEERMDTPRKEEKGEEKESKVTYVSSIFLPQERRRTITNGAAAGEEVTSCTITTKRAQRVVEEVRVDTTEVEVKMEKRQEQERFWRRQLEAEVALEELRKRREEQRRAREEDKRKKEEEEHLRQVQEQESIRQMRAAIERRRIEAEKMKRLSITEGEEPFSPVNPKSPTFKNETEERVTAENTSSIVERTESLNRSLKKNNGVKTLPPVLVSTIDIRLKQYTHALETSCREGRQTVTDIPRSPEPVASKKSLFEDGDAWSQSSARSLQLKDTDGLKVGVADRISHWVKGNPESCSRNPPLKPSNVKAGDVQSKKSLWESVRASCSEGSAGKGSFCGNRYRFVVTGHGKYEKMAVSDDENE